MLLQRWPGDILNGVDNLVATCTWLRDARGVEVVLVAGRGYFLHIEVGSWALHFFFHIYLARVSRLMSKSFDILCISPASTNRNINKFTKCEHLLLATNAGQ